MAGIIAQVYLGLLLTLVAIAIVPAALGWHATVIQTGSMQPHIDPGEVVVSSALSDDAPVPVGGVVQYRSPATAEPDHVARLRMHRIVTANDDGTYVTAGDANAEVDSTPLTREQITGQARLLVPFIGLPSLWIGHGNFLSLALWVAGTLLALVALLRTLPPRSSNPTPETGQVPADTADQELGAQLVPAGRTEPGRRSALALAGLATVGALVAYRVPASTAGFTGRTTTAGNTWTVAALPTLSLGRAAGYTLLAATGIRNSSFLGTGSSVNGSVATSPGTSIDGFWPWDITGATDRNTTNARNARSDALTLYTALDAYPATKVIPPTLTGTLSPGVYTSTTGAFTISGTLTLDGGGDPSARFIFRATSITAAPRSTVTLTNDAFPNRVYWKSTTTITLGESSTGRGTYLASGDATASRNTSLYGRLISLNGAIAISRSTITNP
ncbi:DUF3494 domain-containing protein [Kocuria sp. cx-116]|uniref:ice-binding family protein n=1 Tax=Kocuria sp. cx-116 TaxID=2771378 RepID=UPI001683DE3B|nr:ice-binding family protein [Kocuria sp. cx-116]MBD2761374.1 DUF3494 domain-containing protein [Kocuria sp. cx-116]